MEKHKSYGVCFTWIDIVDENNENINDLWKDSIKNFCSQNYSRSYFYQFGYNIFPAPSALIRRECLDNLGFFRLGLIQTQDYDLWLRILSEYDYYQIPQVLLKYRHFQKGANQRHLSYLTIEKENRVLHETKWLIYTNIMNLSTDSFKYLFSNRLINSAVDDDEGVLCEKILLLKDIGNPFAYIEFLKNLDRKPFVDTITNKYNFSLADFYKYNMSMFTLDNQLARYADVLQEKYNELKEV